MTTLEKGSYLGKANYSSGTKRPGGMHLLTAAAVLLLVLPLAAAAQTDWGGFVDSSSELQYDGVSDFTQEAKLGLWLDTSFSEALSLEAQGSYRYALERPFFAAADRLVLNGEVVRAGESGYRLLIKTGRFRQAEASEWILDHRLDGAEVSWDTPGVSLSVGGGYTGLTFVPNNRILVTGSDLGVHASAPESGYGLAPPKAIEQLELTFPQLLLNQDVTFLLLAQQDLQRDADLLSSGDRIHTEYAGLALSGTAAEDLFHRLYGYFNYGHGAYTTMAYLAGGELTYYMEEFYFSRLRLRALYSSGDSAQQSYYGGYTGGDASGHFIPLSHREKFGLVFSPSPGNITAGELSYSLKPFTGTRTAGLEKLQVELRAMSFLRTTTGAISESDVNTSSVEHYLGSEADLRLRYRPFSDLGVTFTAGLFFPNSYSAESALLQSRPAVETAARLEVSFRF